VSVLDTQDVATKQDLRELEANTDSRFELLRKDMRNEITLVRKDMEAVRKDIIIKMGGMLIVAVGVIVGALKLLVG